MSNGQVTGIITPKKSRRIPGKGMVLLIPDRDDADYTAKSEKEGREAAEMRKRKDLRGDPAKYDETRQVARGRNIL